MWRIRILSGPKVGQEFPVSAAPLRIGRIQGEVQFTEDPEVADLHLHLSLDADKGKVALKSLVPQGGVYINGSAVTAAVLEPGDCVTFGGSELVVIPPENYSAPAEARPRLIEKVLRAGGFSAAISFHAFAMIASFALSSVGTGKDGLTLFFSLAGMKLVMLPWGLALCLLFGGFFHLVFKALRGNAPVRAALQAAIYIGTLNPLVPTSIPANLFFGVRSPVSLGSSFASAAFLIATFAIHCVLGARLYGIRRVAAIGAFGALLGATGLGLGWHLSRVQDLKLGSAPEREIQKRAGQDPRASCSLGDAWSCRIVAEELLDDGDLAGAEKYLRLFMRGQLAMDRKFIGFELGKIARSQRGKGHPDRAVRLYSILCEEGEPVSCFRLGLAEGMAGDFESAAKHYLVFWEKGDAMNLGNLFREHCSAGTGWEEEGLVVSGADRARKGAAAQHLCTLLCTPENLGKQATIMPGDCEEAAKKRFQ